MKSPFKPHGSYQARIKGRILVAHSQGTWNLEMYHESARIAGPLIKELNLSGPWAYMVVVEETVLYHREVLEKSGEWVRTKYANQLVAAAWVMAPDLEGLLLLKPAYAKAYKGHIPCEVFETAQEAKDWLLPQIRT